MPRPCNNTAGDLVDPQPLPPHILQQPNSPTPLSATLTCAKGRGASDGINLHLCVGHGLEQSESMMPSRTSGTSGESLAVANTVRAHILSLQQLIPDPQRQGPLAAPSGCPKQRTICDCIRSHCWGLHHPVKDGYCLLPLKALLACAYGRAVNDNVRHNLAVLHPFQQLHCMHPSPALLTGTYRSTEGDDIRLQRALFHVLEQLPREPGFDSLVTC
mmetsp:Transcript_43214/g.78630  ORF Transcript_43214/g.78630 Transcript_43214/m.78630 type:complete len:216 (-) Transcript_43214:593-1240(-)